MGDVKAEFQYVDADNSGFISRDEFKDFADSWIAKIKHNAGEITAAGFVEALISLPEDLHVLISPAEGHAFIEELQRTSDTPDQPVLNVSYPKFIARVLCGFSKKGIRKHADIVCSRNRLYGKPPAKKKKKGKNKS